MAPINISILGGSVRRLVAIVAASVLLGLTVLLVYDVLRPVRGPTLGMVLVRTWPLTALLVLVSLVAFGGILALSRRKEGRAVISRWRRLVLAMAVLCLLPEALLMLEDSVYQPLKFSYLIRRVENADTPAAERTAFALADRWGYVWELNRLTQREWWPASKRDLAGAWLLELEWLESSIWSGHPYRAYRVVLDERSLDVMYAKRSKTK